MRVGLVTALAAALVLLGPARAWAAGGTLTVPAGGQSAAASPGPGAAAAPPTTQAHGTGTLPGTPALRRFLSTMALVASVAVLAAGMLVAGAGALRPRRRPGRGLPSP
jgi:hypothetical protein